MGLSLGVLCALLIAPASARGAVDPLRPVSFLAAPKELSGPLEESIARARPPSLAALSLLLDHAVGGSRVELPLADTAERLSTKLREAAKVPASRRVLQAIRSRLANDRGVAEALEKFFDLRRKGDALGMEIAAVLTPDLLKPRWRGDPNPVAGHCYVAAEAAYHLLGGKAAGWTPRVIRLRDGTHWFIQHESGLIVDPTQGQFSGTVPYRRGIPSGFLTRQPSRRAAEVLRRLRERAAAR